MMSEVCKDTEVEPKLIPLSGEELQDKTSNNSNKESVDIRVSSFLGTSATDIFWLMDFQP